MGNEAEKFRTPIPKALAELEAKVDKEMVDEAKGLKIHNPDLNKREDEDEHDQPEAEEHEPERVVSEDADTWRHKYGVLEAKFASQDREQKRQIATMESRLASLQETISNQNELILGMRDRPSQPTRPNEPEPNADLMEEFSEDEFDGYGPEMTRLVQRVNAQAKELKTLRSKTERIDPERVDRIAQDVEAGKQDAFHAQIAKHCKHWEEINQETDGPDSYPFSGWLGTGGVAALNAAYKRGDAAGVAKFFNDYIRLTGWSPAGGTGRASEIGDLETPEVGTGEEVPSGGPKPKRRVSEDQYQQAIKDKIHGRISDAEFDKILLDYQRTIQEARAAGRKK